MVHRSTLVSKLNVNNTSVQQRVKAIQQSFISKGINSDADLKSSYSAMDHIVSKQAAVLSYMDVFFYLGVIFLVCVPFVLILKGNKKTATA
jgi:DHA2 family multidrug resistance protein